MNKTRIEQLEVGDMVVIDTGSTYNRYVTGQVKKVTATQLTIGNDRYNKRNGIRIGDSDSHYRQQEIAITWPGKELLSIEEAERRNKVTKDELRVKLLAVKIKDAPLGKLTELPIETLQEVIRLLGLEGGESPPGTGRAL